VKLICAAITATALAVACGGGSDAGKDTTKSASATPASSGAGGADLTGAGASFPYPIYAKWFADYAAKTGVKINYANLGSGAGIRQLSEQTVDFGASDAPMSDDEMAKAKGGPIVHVPTVLGAVVITYNLPTVTTPLQLTGPVIADIFLGKITKWNDPRIASLNPNAGLPGRDIQVVHRSDGSGTTFIFSDYLTAVSSEWKAGPGKGKDLKWPVGLGGNQNPGVAGTVKQTPGSIGYVELAYARQNRLPTASIQNADGKFVAPSIEAITAAAAGVAAKLPANTDYRISIVNAPGASSYPISSFTWLLIYKNQTDAAKAKKLADFLRWALRDGEAQASALDYAPLPSAMVGQLDAIVNALSSAAPK